MWAVAIHGGAGAWEPGSHESAQAGVRTALEVAIARLRDGAPALDAAIAAAVALEDDPAFNAGTGSTLTLRGEVECDASVMDGATGTAGAVAAVRGVKNPVLLADWIRRETDHVLIAGDGAAELARVAGLATGNEPTEARRARWRAALEKLEAGDAPAAPRLLALVRAHPELSRTGTIGAVVVDASGRCAAATSTGGVLLKLAGRVGDTPMLGAGTWADAHGAGSATGRGELVMRALTTRLACERLAAGVAVEAAARQAVDATGTEVGLVLVDAAGHPAAAHATAFMPHALCSEGGRPIVRMSAC